MPLTREQIFELFSAGQLRRNDPCKLAVKAQWRTIDELFPLLKYESADWLPTADLRRSVNPSVFGFGALAVGIVAVLVTNFTILRNDPITAISTRGPILNQTTPGESAGSLVAAKSRTSMPNRFVTNNALLASSQPPLPSRPTAIVQPDVVQIRRDNYERERTRLEQARAAREQLQRDQAALAEQLRADTQQRERTAQRAAGIDTFLQLDTWGIVNLGGSAVTLKVHDNDVTSFDVWINGSWRREVKKEKGITQSGTDETFISSNGRASLYYVWELSGKLNHCRLRVREG